MKKLVTFIIAIPFFMYLIPLQVHAENSPSIQDEIIYDILVDRFNNGSQGPSEQVDIEAVVAADLQAGQGDAVGHVSSPPPARHSASARCRRRPGNRRPR